LESVGSIWLQMGRVWWQTLSSPLFLLLYLLVFFLISRSYGRRKPADNSGKKPYDFLPSTFLSLLFSLCGGLIGSALLTMAGIDLRNINILALWLLALGLALIHPRLICFAYAGGLLAWYDLMSSQPTGCVPQIIGLIAILHLIESLLILVDGSTRPGRVEIKKQGQAAVQGLQLQRFWPLLLVITCSADIEGGTTMPAWWPLLKCYPPANPDSLYIMLPVLAVLGYSETVSRSTPRRQVIRSARNLAVYSLTLLSLALGASAFPFLCWAAALFAPLGHELLIWLGKRC
jgi:hypothetical protein